MKNSDMPAMPQSATSEGHACNYGNVEGLQVPTGLTKREMFAMHAMNTVIGNYNPYDDGSFDSSNWQETAKNCVGLADALLAELENDTSKAR